MKTTVTALKLVTIYKNVLKDDVISSFVDFISLLTMCDNFDEILKGYSKFIAKLYEKEPFQNLFMHLKNLIYTDENVISKGCSSCSFDNKYLIDTAKYELSLFDKLLEFDYSRIKNEFVSRFPAMSDLLTHLPIYKIDVKENFDINAIINSYDYKGYGVFPCYNAFYFTKDKEIVPVENFDDIRLSDLKNYEYQKSVIVNNTKSFLDCRQANNILLYGDRGCGKSSTVKALINEFSRSNLKIVQVCKESFIYLSELFEILRNQPANFIIFADDISFDENDKDFSSIKAALEGSLTSKPQNVVIYATTNRMHLVKETFSSREGNDVHYNDTIDEMSSLADRFGIMLTFSLLTKKEYLDIVEQIAIDCCVEVNDTLYKEAEAFAALKSIRTPRVARQFIVDFIAKHKL